MKDQLEANKVYNSCLENEVRFCMLTLTLFLCN
jgi:hypothetical protein